MAAAPQSGTLFFVGLTTKTTYAVDIYISDVVSGMVTFDAGGGAGATSPSFYTFPENVMLTDMSILTGLTDTTKIRLVGNGRPSSQVLRYALHLTTLNNRPKLGIGVTAMHRFAAIQLA